MLDYWQKLTQGLYKLQSPFDEVKLLAIDHSVDKEIGVSPTGEILPYSYNSLIPYSAVDNNGRKNGDILPGNVRDFIFISTGNYYKLGKYVEPDKIVVYENVDITLRVAGRKGNTVEAYYFDENFGCFKIDFKY